MEGEPPLTVSEGGVVDVLEALLNRRPRLPPAALEVALTAAAKLTARLPSQVMIGVVGGGGKGGCVCGLGWQEVCSAEKAGTVACYTCCTSSHHVIC